MRDVDYTLKPAVIDNAEPGAKAYSLADGGGLLLEVLPSGSMTAVQLWGSAFSPSCAMSRLVKGIAAECQRRLEIAGSYSHAS